VTLETPAIQDGQILLKQTHMSLDPAMRGWMSADTNSYIPPVELGSVMRSSGVAEVVESKNDRFPVGTRVVGMIGWTEYAVSKGDGLQKLPPDIPAEAVLSVLALPGLTAYQGLIEIGKPKAGETLVVSGAAGSVGSMVGQIAKAEGLRVIGTAGTDEKCAGWKTNSALTRRSITRWTTWRNNLRQHRRHRYLLRKHGRSVQHRFRSHECAWSHHRLRNDRRLQHRQTIARSELAEHHKETPDDPGLHYARSLGPGTGNDGEAFRVLHGRQTQVSRAQTAGTRKRHRRHQPPVHRWQHRQTDGRPLITWSSSPATIL
jgi:hypothetical protein